MIVVTDGKRLLRHKNSTNSNNNHNNNHSSSSSELVTTPRRVWDLDDLLVITQSIQNTANSNTNSRSCNNGTGNISTDRTTGFEIEIEEDSILQITCGSRHTALRTESGRVLVM